MNLLRAVIRCDAVKRAVASRIVSIHISCSERLDESIIGSIGLGGSHPCERIDSTLLEAVLRILSNDASEFVRRDVRGLEVDTIKANTGRDPLAVNVLERVDAHGAVKGNAVKDALKAGIGPDTRRVGLVFLDKSHCAESTVDLEAILTVHSTISMARGEYQEKEARRVVASFGPGPTWTNQTP